MVGARGPSSPAVGPGQEDQGVRSKAPQREAEARRIIKTAPGVGTVTAEVVLSELGDVSGSATPRRLRLCRDGTVVRQSGGKKSKDLAISKRARGYCVGLWSKQPGDWSTTVQSGNGSTSESASGPEGSEPSWRSPGNCCASFTRCSRQ